MVVVLVMSFDYYYYYYYYYVPKHKLRLSFPASHFRSSAILFIADYSKQNSMILGGQHRHNIHAKFGERQSVSSIAETEITVDRVNLSRAGFLPFQKIKYEGWNFNSGNYLFTTDTK